MVPSLFEQESGWRHGPTMPANARTRAETVLQYDYISAPAWRVCQTQHVAAASSKAMFNSC